ncbi:MAG TPA: SMR family transporter [Candidatus Binatia bacterium]
MAWIRSYRGALIDVAMVVAFQYSDGWTHFWPTLLGLLLANAPIYLLMRSLKSLPVGATFAVFTGIGAIGITLIGVSFSGE